MKDHQQAVVLNPGDGRPIDLGGFVMCVKASGSETDGAFSLLEASEPPGFGPPMHIHHDAAETFYVLSGEYNIFLEDDVFRCPAGSFVHIPAGLVHGFRVGTEPSSKLNLYTPAAMVGYFDDLGDALAGGMDDPDRLAEIAARHSMEIVGPVPASYL